MKKNESPRKGAKKPGRKPGLPLVRTQVLLPVPMHAFVEKEALRRGVSMSGVVRDLIKPMMGLDAGTRTDGE